MPLKGMQRAFDRAIDVGRGYSGGYEVIYGAMPWTAELWHGDHLLASVTAPGKDGHLSVEAKQNLLRANEGRAIVDFFKATGASEDHIDYALEHRFWSKYDLRAQ